MLSAEFSTKGFKRGGESKMLLRSRLQSKEECLALAEYLKINYGLPLAIRKLRRGEKVLLRRIIPSEVKLSHAIVNKNKSENMMVVGLRGREPYFAWVLVSDGWAAIIKKPESLSRLFFVSVLFWLSMVSMETKCSLSYVWAAADKIEAKLLLTSGKGSSGIKSLSITLAKAGRLTLTKDEWISFLLRCRREIEYESL